MLIHSIATRPIQEIHASSISSVIDLIEVLLSTQNLVLQALVTPIKSKDGTWHILNAFAHACRETIIDWAIEQTCGTFESEILEVSRVGSGLHFNASQACADNILGFNLEDIS